jgi:hypothetical protein
MKPVVGRERVLHVAALSALAVAQPLFDVLGRNAMFFVAHRAGPGDMLGFVAMLVLAPMLLILSVEAAAGAAGSHARALVQRAVVAALVALIVLPPLNRVAGVGMLPALAVALVAGGIAAVAYGWTPVRTFLAVLSPAALVFPALFLLHPSVRRMVLPQAVDVAGSVHAGAPVVMVLFDALPLNSLLDERNGIDGVRYPSFARLARGATWYRGATTVAQETGAAVPAILTGRYPTGGLRPPTAAEHPRNLFTLLGGSYDLHVRETLTELCPASLCPRDLREDSGTMSTLLLDTAVVYAHLVVPRALRSRLPSIEDQWAGFGLSRTRAPRTQALWWRATNVALSDRATAFADFLGSIDAPSRPTLYFLHIMLPHSPWTYFPSGRSYGDLPGFLGTVTGGWADESAARQAEQRHLLQVGFVDTLVGRLLDRLEATGLYDRALLVVTADHGASFLPRQPYRLATMTNAADIARVPLFVKAPEQREGRVSDRNVETVDILPTMAELLGVELPWPVDGTSAVSGPPRADKRLETRGPNPLRFPAAVAPGPGVAARLARFGAGTSWDALFAGGPYAALVGKRVDALDGAGIEGFVLQPLRTWSEHVDAGSPLLPALVEGPLDSQTLAAAVVVNGTIGAVGPASPTRDGSRGYSALVPESLFRPGDNALQVFGVKRAP